MSQDHALAPSVTFTRRDLMGLALGGLAAIVLAFACSAVQLPIIQGSKGREFLPIELFGFFFTAVLSLYAWRKLRGRAPWSASRLVLVLLPCLVMTRFTTLNTEFSKRSYDYLCYEQGAKDIIQGRPLYRPDNLKGNFGYIYPPLAAQGLAVAYRVIRPLMLRGRPEAELAETRLWPAVFNLYQCLNVLSLGLGLYLSLQLLLRLKLGGLPSTLIACGLFGLSSLIVRNLSFNQVNILVLNTYLLGVLALGRMNSVAGVAASIGFHIKLWPVTLLPLWVVERRWATILSAVAGTLALFALTTLSGGVRLWSDFLDLLPHFPTSRLFRDNSVQRVIDSVLSLIHAGTLSGPLAKLVALGVLFWIGKRMRDRRRLVSTGEPIENAFGHPVPPEVAARFADGADLIALPLLVSPLVWEHHYVLSIPLALVAMALYWRRNPALVLIGTLLILAPPIFDIFPFSFHRLAGLVLLLRATSPSCLALARTEAEANARVDSSVG